MRRRVTLALALVCGATPAGAAEDLVSTRALGMGEALRAGGAGASALYLNPAGMTTAQQYVLEVDYQYRASDAGHTVGVTIVDSVTAALAAGVFYDFVTSEPIVAGEQIDVSAHEVGLALAFPFSDALAVGATGRYLNADGAAFEGASDLDASELTLDAGIVLRFGALRVGAAGQNLVSDPPLVRRQLGGGVGYAFEDFLLVEIDARWDLDRRDEASPRYGGGAELSLADAVAIRAGGVHEAAEDATYVTGGLAYVSGGAAIEASVRQQVDAGDETLLSVAVRLFAE